VSTILSLFDEENRWMPPRELVLASAGSGKTFRISSGIIALLARGEAPDDIFASTFTRKAAGEILDRVLVRLARAVLDPVEAGALAVHTELVPEGATKRELAQYDGTFWSGVLVRSVRHLHRMNIGTLDAFFLRIAAAFGHELGMPPQWTIADEATSSRLRSLALQDVLRAHDEAALLKLIQSINRNPLARSLHDAMLRRLRELAAVHHALDPERDDHWSGFDAETGGVDEAWIARERVRLAAAARALELPKTRAGKPVQNFVKNVGAIAEALESGDWESFVKSTLVQRAREGAPFTSVDVPEPICRVIDQAWDVARGAVALRMSRRSHALGEFARLFAEALERRRTEFGAFEFDDVTRVLGGPDPLGSRPDLHYRLDARTRHVLLDEFQDTSVPQWQALKPLADELLSGHRDERGAIIVADPKQSIYGWRGGTPDLTRHLLTSYQLDRARLDQSWRSSHVILDFVNRIHDRFRDPAVWGDPRYAEVAADWLSEFWPHAPARHLPGFVEITIGPEDDRGEARPNLIRFAAEEVQRLAREAPGRTIGVLTRTNAAVARMMLNLRDLGVHASEEGGNALADAAPVAAILALLRMCDNPGNCVARYHVARSPLGEEIGYTDHRDQSATLATTSREREQLLAEGYGARITALAGRLARHSDARERRRLAQLAELAFRFDPIATLRPSDFVHFVRHERVEDPVAADVRVMTVHQAKGLEFDIVVLPELDADLVGGRPPDVLVYREEAGAPVARAFPYLNKDLRALFPALRQLQLAQEQLFRNELRDGLSGLYVAVTRPRHALHIIAKPDQGNTRTGARVILRALAPGQAKFQEGNVVHQQGDAAWHRTLKGARSHAGSPPGGEAPHEGAGSDEATTAATSTAIGVTRPPLLLRQSTGRTRALPRRSPSQLEGDGRVDLGMVLRLTPAAARGSVAHRWLATIGWSEDGTPPDDELRALARVEGSSFPESELDDLVIAFHGWLANPTIARLLSRRGWPEGATVECEVPFITRTGDVLMEGFIDRLVLYREQGRVTGAAVFDWKTDAVSGAADVRTRTAHYRPQINAYRKAVAGMYALGAEAVDGWLVFLEAGTVVRIDREV
jgi:ATP-dependent helicase/nuclease subunit A